MENSLHRIPYIILLPEHLDMQINTRGLLPELVPYARFREGVLPLLGVVFNRHEIPLEVRIHIIDIMRESL